MKGIVRPNGTARARRWARCILPAAALSLVLGGCAGDDEEAAQSSTASSEDFPNLASVPEEAPPSTPRVERETLIEGLQADRANAEYTGEQLGEAEVNAPPAEPPPPGPPKPEAEADPAEGDAGEAEEAEAAEAEAEDAPTVTTPADVAALPVDFGEPLALIYFGGDTATLTDHDRAVLTDVAKAYTRQRGSRVRVIGHAASAEATSAAGEPGLAAARADAVAQTLIALGVPANALETTTGGATYDESQPNGVAANRRVEVYIGS
jgi:outer membrane protein OmpA-like peptidoglycan-associated protein